jgi:hypothetical protein
MRLPAAARNRIAAAGGTFVKRLYRSGKRAPRAVAYVVALANALRCPPSLEVPAEIRRDPVSRVTSGVSFVVQRHAFSIQEDGPATPT